MSKKRRRLCKVCNSPHRHEYERLFDSGMAIKHIWRDVAKKKNEEFSYYSLRRHLLRHYEPKRKIMEKMVLERRNLDESVVEVRNLLDSIEEKLRIIDSLITSAIQSLSNEKPSPQMLNAISNLISKSIKLTKMILTLRKEFKFPTEAKMEEDFRIFFNILSTLPEEYVLYIYEKLLEEYGLKEEDLFR